MHLAGEGGGRRRGADALFAAVFHAAPGNLNNPLPAHMPMEKSTIASLIVIIAAFAISAYAYPYMPDPMVSHWGAGGEANGSMPRDIALFFVPVISVALFLLLKFLPDLMPLKKNFAKFKPHYGLFIIVMLGFLAYIHVLTIAWNFGLEFGMMQALAPAFAGLFYVMGAVMQRTKRNWFMGIRTPWTMSSEDVWDKTHQFGGKLFKAAGGIALVGMVFTDIAIWLIIGPVLLASLASVAYSYLEFNKKKRK